MGKRDKMIKNRNNRAYVKSICGEMYEYPLHQIRVLNTVAKHFDVAIELINQRTRKNEIKEARQVAQALFVHELKLTLAKAGEKIGKKGHATVINSIKRVSEYYTTEKEYRLKIKAICDDLKIDVDSFIKKCSK